MFNLICLTSCWHNWDLSFVRERFRTLLQPVSLLNLDATTVNENRYILFVGNLLKRMFNVRNLVILAFIGFSNAVAAKMSFFIKGL